MGFDELVMGGCKIESLFYKYLFTVFESRLLRSWLWEVARLNPCFTNI
jgi:hypothetical protein